jgi:nucleoside-triphosphatase THEP1
MCGTLSKNSTLRELNLSGNNFDCETIDNLVERLAKSESESGLTFLRFDSNTPPLTDAQLVGLDIIERRSRMIALERFLSTEVRNQPFETNLYPEIAQRNHSVRYVNSGEDDTVSLFSEDGLIRADSVQPRTGENEITVLFSAPLVFQNIERKLCPFEKLDFAMERDLLWACLKEASRDIKLSFDNATKSRLLAAKAKRPSCLHFSGHGDKLFLLLESESGTGGVQGMSVGELKELITQEGGAPFKFVFVSACFSLLAGETFASAGVPHVVCCEEEAELKDAAALAFTKQFYLSLAVGNTVRESFEQGRLAVGATANLRSADLEMKKFVLLPRDGNHDVPVFSATPIPDWPRAKSNKTVRERNLIRSRSSFIVGARNFELSVRNMMQEFPSPTPPQFFLGREVDMFHVLGAVLTKRLVIVTGEPGVGRSSLVCAICHYINERKSTIINVSQMFHVKVKEEGRGGDRCRLLVKALLMKLVEAKAAKIPAEIDQMGVEDFSEVICNALTTAKALIVFDHTELLENNDEAQEFSLCLRMLLHYTQNVRVLITDRKPLRIPSIGGVIPQHYPLRGLTFSNSVRLFAKACCHLHTGAERVHFFERMIIDDEQADLIFGDPNCTERTTRLFKIIGFGMPGLVEKSASAISADEVMTLGSRD